MAWKLIRHTFITFLRQEWSYMLQVSSQNPINFILVLYKHKRCVYLCMAQISEKKGFYNNSKESHLPLTLYILVFSIYGIFGNTSWTLISSFAETESVSDGNH